MPGAARPRPRTRLGTYPERARPGWSPGGAGCICHEGRHESPQRPGGRATRRRPQDSRIPLEWLCRRAAPLAGRWEGARRGEEGGSSGGGEEEEEVEGEAVRREGRRREDPQPPCPLLSITPRIQRPCSATRRGRHPPPKEPQPHFPAQCL